VVPQPPLLASRTAELSPAPAPSPAAAAAGGVRPGGHAMGIETGMERDMFSTEGLRSIPFFAFLDNIGESISEIRRGRETTEVETDARCATSPQGSLTLGPSSSTGGLSFDWARDNARRIEFAQDAFVDALVHALVDRSS